MDIVPVLVTAGVGFAAAQLGAYLQFRRDLRNQDTRDDREAKRLEEQLHAEAGRLRQQLDADANRQSRQLEADAEMARRQREYNELIDWRERRITAYRAVSLATARLIEDGNSASYRGAPWALMPMPEWSVVNSHVTDLRGALDECDVISGEAVRIVGEALWDAALEFREACGVRSATLERLSHAEKRAKAKRQPDAGGLGQMFDDIFIGTVSEAKERQAKAEQRWRAAGEAIVDVRSTWTAACRLYLGVPD